MRAFVAGLLAIALYLFDGSRDRHSGLLWVDTTKWLIALFAWMVLSLAGSLVLSSSFDLVFGNFIKTVLMYGVIAGAVRGYRDIDRLAAVYLLGVVLYAGVVLARFDIGKGSDWRLGHLYYYDANDFATFLVTALPLALYAIHRARTAFHRVLGVAAQPTRIVVAKSIVATQAGLF